MKITVTESDIRSGIPSSHKCPVALAVRRAAGTDDVAVFTTGCRVGDRHVALPRETRAWIRQFDDAYTSLVRRDWMVRPSTLLEPFEFELPEPPS